jgi:hypothetical protein
MASTVVCDMRLVMATILWPNGAPVKPFRPVAPLRPIGTHAPVVLASRISAHPAAALCRLALAGLVRSGTLSRHKGLKGNSV